MWKSQFIKQEYNQSLGTLLGFGLGPLAFKFVIFKNRTLQPANGTFLGLCDATPAESASWMVLGHVAIASWGKVFRDAKGSASGAGYVYRGISGVALDHTAEGAGKLLTFGPFWSAFRASSLPGSKTPKAHIVSGLGAPAMVHFLEDESVCETDSTFDLEGLRLLVLDFFHPPGCLVCHRHWRQQRKHVSHVLVWVESE